MLKDRRKRIRCKLCGKRINVNYEVDWDKRTIRFACPNCFGNGELTLTKRV